MNKSEEKAKKGRGKQFGGRPEKEPTVKRTHFHKFYMNQEEKNKLDAMYNSSSFQSKNELIRAMLFENSVKLYYEDKNRETLIYHLGKIGGNVNQIAKNMNKMKNTFNSVSKKDMDTVKELVDILSNLKI